MARFSAGWYIHGKIRYIVDQQPETKQIQNKLVYRQYKVILNLKALILDLKIGPNQVDNVSQISKKDHLWVLLVKVEAERVHL